MAETQREADQRSASLLMGVAAGVALGSLLFSTSRFDRFIDSSPLPRWSSVVAAAAALLVGFVWAAREHSRLWLVFVTSLIPMAVGGVGVRLTRPHAPWALQVRSVGVAIVLTSALTLAFLFARRLRELDRVVYTEATSIAFFVTAAGCGFYGAMQKFLNAPRLSLVWVPIFAAVSWAVAAFLVERRYS